MKMMKKVMALILSLLVVMSMAVPVVGADEETLTLTVKNPEGSNVSIVGKTFNAYKIFDASYTTTEAGTVEHISYTIKSSDKFYNTVVSYLGSGTETNGVRSGNGLKLTKTAIDGEYNVSTDNTFDARAFATAMLAKVNDTTSPVTPDGTATGTAASTGEQEKVTISNLTPGYYLVTSSATTSDNSQNVVAAASLDTVVPNKEIDMKIGAPDIDKVIVNADSATAPNTDGKGTAVNVGDTVNFKLTSNVPDTNGYETYKFIITDTLSKGLTLNTSDGTCPFTVKVGETNVELIEADDAEGVDGTADKYYVDGQSIKIGIAMLKTENGKTVTKYTENSAITVTYSATLNRNALLTGEEDNTVNLQYSNNPYEDSLGKTTDKKTYVYDFEIVIDKYATPATNPDDDDSITRAKRLKGAEFVLYTKVTTGGAETKKYYKYDDTTSKVTWETSIENATKVTTNDEGSAKFAGLDAGTYYLQETKAPTGYNPLTEDIEVKITAAYNDDGKLNTGEDSGTTVTAVTNADDSTSTIGYQITSKVGNSSGSALPETGGIGTTIFYVVGGIMMVVAIVLLVTKKKMSKK